MLSLFFQIKGDSRVAISLVKNETIITDGKESTEIFNEDYVNIVEKSSGKKPIGLAKGTGSSDDCQIALLSLDKYKQKQCVPINNTYISFQEVISGVPQGSVLGPN